MRLSDPLGVREFSLLGLLEAQGSLLVTHSSSCNPSYMTVPFFGALDAASKKALALFLLYVLNELGHSPKLTFLRICISQMK